MTAELNKLDFAQQVRAERLSLLWKITIFLALFLIWGGLILFSLSSTSPADLLIPTAVVIIGCLGCRFLLARNNYTQAVWSYIIGLMVAVALLSHTSDPQGLDAGRQAFLFVFPIIILLVGFLLPIRDTFLALGIGIILVFVVPSLGGMFSIERTQVFASVLMIIAAGIAVQMSGALYGIADWALENYRRERETKDQLFNSQEEIQRSFLRQKALSEQLQETNYELETARSAAIEAKNFRGQFLANMSHELRTPLNAIIGFSETMLNFPMMYENVPLPAAYKADLTQIYTSGKHLLQLINDILDLSKVDYGRLEMEVEEVDLDPIFKGVLATAVGLIGDKPIKLKREVPPNLPHIRGDSLRIRQVMLNLLSNASKFTDEGTITVGARHDGNGEVTIWVRDSGIGIPPQEVDNIFEEFRQGTSGRKKGRAGSGLGLAISRQLLKLMGGQIRVESTLGQGSTFLFMLPVYVAESVEQQG
ncbi:MAG: HAMP domain-containing sensor histidine kinase [Chloroflexota bacterium]